MSFTIKKVRTTTYEIKQLSINFIRNINDYLRIRADFKRKMTSCFNCRRKFDSKIDDGITLAITTNKGNVVLCNPCAEEIASTGQVEVFRHAAN